MPHEWKIVHSDPSERVAAIMAFYGAAEGLDEEMVLEEPESVEILKEPGLADLGECMCLWWVES